MSSDGSEDAVGEVLRHGCHELDLFLAKLMRRGECDLLLVEKVLSCRGWISGRLR